MALGICRDDRVLLQNPEPGRVRDRGVALFRVGCSACVRAACARENELVGIAGAAEAVDRDAAAHRCRRPPRPRRIGGGAAQVPSLWHIIDVDDLATIYADPIDHERSDPSEMAFLQPRVAAPAFPS